MNEDKPFSIPIAGTGSRASRAHMEHLGLFPLFGGANQNVIVDTKRLTEDQSLELARHLARAYPKRVHMKKESIRINAPEAPVSLDEVRDALHLPDTVKSPVLTLPEIDDHLRRIVAENEKIFPRPLEIVAEFAEEAAERIPVTIGNRTIIRGDNPANDLSPARPTTNHHGSGSGGPSPSNSGGNGHHHAGANEPPSGGQPPREPPKQVPLSPSSPLPEGQGGAGIIQAAEKEALEVVEKAPKKWLGLSKGTFVGLGAAAGLAALAIFQRRREDRKEQNAIDSLTANHLIGNAQDQGSTWVSDVSAEKEKPGITR